MKRRGLVASMVGSRRFSWIMLAIEELSELGGWKTPSVRNDLMLLRRRREDAEGESRIMGSGRRLDVGLLFGRRAGVALRGMAGVGPFGRAAVRLESQISECFLM